MVSEALSYSIDQDIFTGFLATQANEKRPAVLVVPTWMGLNGFVKEKAEALADLGYVGYAVDLFGGQQEASTPDEAKELIKPLVADRKLICNRLQKAVETIKEQPSVDAGKIAAIGFCFGGMCVLELAKSGYPLAGAVSFHAVFGSIADLPTQPTKMADQIPTPLLMLHGYRDTLAPEEDLHAFERELERRDADWQVHTYGQAMHAFTNPKAQMPDLSLQYHEKSAKRAWRAMQNFLTEVFGPV